MKKNLLAIAVFVVLIALFAGSVLEWRLPGAATPPDPADWCSAHKIALSRCEACSPRLARGGTFVTREREPREGECPNTLVRVTLGPGVAEQVNLQMAAAELKPIAETLRANAETHYIPSRTARVAPRIAGVVREVRAAFGQDVAAGDIVAVVEAPDFGEAKSDYLQALAIQRVRQQTYDQQRPLAEKRIIAGHELLLTQAALDEARIAVARAAQKLAAFGLAPERVRDIGERQDTSALLEVTSPLAGTVVAAAAVPGEIASPEKPLFTVAALDRLWLAVDVFEADLPKVQKDQKVVFTMEAFPGRRFPGAVAAIGGEVDDRTRTVRVFAEVKNLQRLLRANMFGRAEVAVKAAEPKLVVPRDAVQNDGDCTMVFVSPSPSVFQARKVDVGAAYDAGYEITGGLAAGEKVVTVGSFLLKTEVLRGQIGAG